MITIENIEIINALEINHPLLELGVKLLLPKMEDVPGAVNEYMTQRKQLVVLME